MNKILTLIFLLLAIKSFSQTDKNGNPDGSDMLRFDTRFESAFYDKKQIKNKKN